MKEDHPRIKVPTDLRRKMVEIARQFRKEPTPSEAILWQALRGKKLDELKFRRQQPVGSFIVDFYNSTYRLVVEVDGPIHDYQVEADQVRQELLEIIGLNVLRLKAEMVEINLPTALSLIRAKIREIEEHSRPRIEEEVSGAQFPSPFMGEGRDEAISSSSLAGEGRDETVSPSPLVGEGRGGG